MVDSTKIFLLISSIFPCSFLRIVPVKGRGRETKTKGNGRFYAGE
jgi:hypothetical protein